MDDHSVLRRLGKQAAKRIAPWVGKMLLAEQGVAEGQPCGDPVFPHQRQNLPGSLCAAADAPSAPDTVRRRAVDGANVTPVIKIFPVRTEQRQKHTVQLMEFKQTGQVIVRGGLFCFAHGKTSSYGVFKSFFGEILS